jgi:hypothetical protein
MPAMASQRVSGEEAKVFWFFSSEKNTLAFRQPLELGFYGNGPPRITNA